MEIRLDGEWMEVSEGSRIADILPDRDPACSVAVIRPAEMEAAVTHQVRIASTIGDLIVNTIGASPISAPEASDLVERLRLHWVDRYAAAFGPFSSDIVPAREQHRYERGDLILGCGGYDPGRSYLIFAKVRHMADHGAPAGGGVIGKVVSGQWIPDRWSEGDRITGIEPVISSADRARSFTTRDDSLVLQDGMQIVTRMQAVAVGFAEGRIDVGTAASTEHLLRTLQDGRFVVGRASSTHIRDERRIRTEVPAEYPGSRLAGSVTVRATGRSAGGIYIYTTDLPGSPVHTVVARVTGGVELAALAQEGDLLCIEIEPERFDVVGLPVQEATAAAHERGIELAVDVGADDRVVVDQKPATTLEVLEGGRATLGTKSLEEVIDIRLDDERAPLTCAVFREITGLLEHAVGRIPFFFRFEDVYLFKPSIARGTSINPENTPSGEVPPFTLAMTNDSRKGSGMVGVRTTSSTEFGPTSEPFSGTNIIGSVLHPEKLARLKEGRMVYIREVR